MISAKFLWGNVLLGGKLQIGAKNSNFEIFESALYMKSVSMPLSYSKTWIPQLETDAGKNDIEVWYCQYIQLALRLGTRPGNSSLARKIRVSGTKMAYSILENSIQVITFFRVDISEVNYATSRYIIDKLQTHFPF